MKPKIKIKEKKSEFNMKVKVSKVELEFFLTSPESLIDFRKDFINKITNELDNFIVKKVKSENGKEAANDVSELLKDN